MKHTQILIVFVIMLLILSCKDNPIENVEEPRIILGESIEGIHIGDDTTAVIKKLGRPDWTRIGDYDGFSYEYENKNFPGLSILSVTFFNRIYGLSPADYRVAVMTVLNSYNGKSKEGIGIGTKREFVKKILGEPKRISTDDAWEAYFFTNVNSAYDIIFVFYYDSFKQVDSIVMSFIMK